jgi:tRNA threonylcarbamoyladenosine dehydratase
MNAEIDFDRRFSGVRRLYGDLGLAKLRVSHVVVLGIGGVGSWAAEALARNAIGKLTLVDLDHIAESNVNRQIHALEDAFGQAKVTAMHARISQINPRCDVHEVEEFVDANNITTLLDIQCDVIVDCVDDAKAKVAIADFCKRKHIPLIMVGSAGGRLDATRIQVADLAHVSGDRLLAKVRNQLRRDHQFPKANQTKKSAKFNIQAVFSDEPVIKPELSCVSQEAQTGITGLNCAGYGSSVCVTAPFGFTAAQLAIHHIIQSQG